MKYCPNPRCPHLQHSREPAEFVETASTCNDCGMTLVAKEALGTDETRVAVEAFHAEVRREVEARVADGTASMEDAAPGRMDFIMAALFFAGAGIVAYVAYSHDGGLGRTAAVISGIFFGVRRILSGVAARRAAIAQQGEGSVTAPK